MTAAKFAGVLAPCLGVLALTGCGGSSAPKTASAVGTTTTQQARNAGQQSRADIGTAQAQVASAGRAPHHGQPAVKSIAGVGPAGRVQHATGAPPRDESSRTGAKQLNPCTLVTMSEAQSITGGSVAGRVEAPLGPTCIFQLSHAKASITIAVESQNFSQVTRHMQQRQRLVIANRQAYCGGLGAQMLFVPLPNGQVLNVTAPCGVAQRLAALALSRLSA